MKKELSPPPSSITGPAGDWLNILWRVFQNSTEIHDNWRDDIAINVKDPRYRGVGDGVADDTSAISKAFSAGCESGRWVDLAWGTYRITSQIAKPANLKVRNGTIDGSSLGATACIVSTGGSVGSDVTLLGNVSSGATQIQLASVSAFTDGDYLVLQDSADWNVAGTVNVSETIRILSISGVTATLYGPIDYSYTTANTAAVAKLTHVPGWEFENVTLIGDDSVTGSIGLNPQYLKDAKFRNVGGIGFRSRALQLRTCYNVEISNQATRDADPLLNGGLNYGASLVDGCHHVRVNSAFADNARHVVTIGGSSWVNRHIQVNGVQGHGLTDAAVDSHAASDHVQVMGVQATARPGGACEAVISQGGRIIVSDVETTGPGFFAAVRWQPNLAFDIPLTGQFKGIQASGDCDRVVSIHQQSTTTVDSVLIDDVQYADRTGKVNTGIEIDAEDGDILDVNIGLVNLDEVTSRGVWIHADAGRIIEGGSLGNGKIRMSAAGANECIRVAGTDADSVTGFVGEGYSLENGTVGIRGVNTDYMTVGPNTYNNQSTSRFEIVGANSKVHQLQDVGADVGNAAKTLVTGRDEQTQVWDTALTAARAVTLSATGAVKGARFKIVRTANATGAFNLNVGTGPLKALAVGEWCIVEYNGTAWFLTSYGAL